MRAAPRTAPVLAALVALLASLPLALPAQAAPAATSLDVPSALPLQDVAFRPDGALALAVGGVPGQGVVVVVQGSQVEAVREDAHRYLAAAWKPHGSEALVVGDGAVLRTTDGRTFTPLALPQGIASFDGRAVAWKPDGSEALLAGSALLRYVASTQALEVVRSSADEAYGSAAWHPQGTHALVEQAVRGPQGWTTGRLVRYDGAALQHVATYGSGKGLVEAIAWSPTGAHALVVGHDAATRDGPVMRWDGSALALASTKPQDRFTAIAFQPGGTHALLTGSGGHVLVRTSDGAHREVLLDQGSDLLGAAWHPGGGWALLAGSGGLLRWDPEGAPLVRILAPFPNQAVHGPFDLVVEASPRAAHALQVVEARISQGPWQPLTLVEGAWGARVDTQALADGAHVLEVRARDALGPSAPAKVQVRLATQPPQAPVLEGVPAHDADGVLRVDWAATGADRYELQSAMDAAFADPKVQARGADSEATVRLTPAGTHWLRVRAMVGSMASPWSAPAQVEVSLTESPFAPARSDAAGSGSSPTQGGSAGQGPGASGDLRGAPLPAALALMALAAAAWTARRRAP
jgi:hypothetical protein